MSLYLQFLINKNGFIAVISLIIFSLLVVDNEVVEKIFTSILSALKYIFSFSSSINSIFSFEFESYQYIDLPNIPIGSKNIFVILLSLYSVMLVVKLL